MADLENNFNSNDFSLISPEGNIQGSFGNYYDYVKLTIRDQNNNIVNYDNNGVIEPAIFYSTVDSALGFSSGNSEGISSFIIQTAGPVSGSESRDFVLTELEGGFGGDDTLSYDNNNGQFKVYENSTNGNIYIKPNEILSSSALPEGNYNLQLDFLNQFPLGGLVEGSIDDTGFGRYQDPADRFVIKEISPSRKEVRIKLLDLPITQQNGQTEIYKNFERLIEPNVFNYVLNIGLSRHIPITNYLFDKFTNGEDNRSIILKLYEPLPSNVGTLQLVTLEKEVLVTQRQSIYYFSDVQGASLVPSTQPAIDYDYPIESFDGDYSYDNYNELTSSLPTEVIESIYTGSSFDYPNLNIDFSEFGNHTFFGSAERKLENFREKVKTIQSNLSKISSSLSASRDKIQSYDDSVDSDDLVQLRQTSFDNIQKEINSFTPYERFLYFDGQNESTASAPGLGKNYAQTFAINKNVSFFPQEPEETNKPEFIQNYSGLPSVYKISSSFGKSKINLFRNLYRAEDKPFFGYSGSVYLSFLVKAEHSSSGGYVNNKLNTGNQYNDVSVGDPSYQAASKTYFLNKIKDPSPSGSQYHRVVYHASSSHFVPNATVGHNTNNLSQPPADSQIDVLLGNIKTGSTAIKAGGAYQNLATHVTESGVSFKGSILPMNDLFRFSFGDVHTSAETATTASYFTDVKVTLNNPTNIQPFGQLFHTSSAEWQSWYDGMIVSASAFDDNNIHSLENNLPTYIQESNDYNDMKKFLSLIGENFDIIRNHIDNLGDVHNRRYEKLESVPANLTPMLLSNLGWDSIIPFSSSLADYFGSSLSSITNESTISQNTLRKVLNNLIYIYKSKGTKNSVRALLNTYGYPPDVLEIKEFGGSNEPQNGVAVTSSNPVIGTTNNDTHLRGTTGNISFKKRKDRLHHFNFSGDSLRTLSLDWYYDNANANTIEFVYKHTTPKSTQTILQSNGLGTEKLWDLRLIPSADGLSSSFEFRLNNTRTGSANITGSAVSMSTNYTKMTDGQLWNVMLQRMTSSNTGNGINEYRLHTTLQQEDRIKVYNYITMSVSGATSASVRDSNFEANSNWFSTGSRHILSSSNLDVGNSMSGSIAEIRTWTTALSSSKFRLHTLDKFSTVGNNVNAYKDELVYHFKLNENYASSSISGSQSTVTIVDANPLGPSSTPTDYSFGVNSGIVSSSILYGYDLIDVYKIGLQDVSQNVESDNKVIIKPNQPLIGNLNPFKSSIKTLHQQHSRPKRTNSTKLEIGRSPQDYVNNFILDKIQGFNLETLYANPKDFYSSSYSELDTFRDNFFKTHSVSVDINKYVRSAENLYNESLTDTIRQLVPAKSTLSDNGSHGGVIIKPTILEKQKYEHEVKSIETNPNVFNTEIIIATGSISLTDSILDLPKSGSINITSSISMSKGEVTLPKSASIEIITGSVNITDSQLILPKSASIEIITGSINITGSELILPKSASIEIVTGSVNLGNGELVLPKSGSSVSTLPNTTGSELILPKSGSNDYIPNNNYSKFVNFHNDWGTGSNDVHFLNMATSNEQTSSDGDYNVNHIERRYIFTMAGDVEIYSGSSGKMDDFTNQERFFNRDMVSDYVHKNVTYESYMHGNPGNQTGRAVGKTRYFITSSGARTTVTIPATGSFSLSADGTITGGNPGVANDIFGPDSGAFFTKDTITLPSNHVRRFSNPWTDRMYEGSKNTKPGQLNVKNYEDYASASFYRVVTTGGENEIRVVSGKSDVDSDDRIIY